MRVKFNIKTWNKHYISAKSTAEWTCTACYEGALQIVQQRITDNRDFFTAILQCTNNQCKHEYTTCGRVVFWSDTHKCEISKNYIGNKTVQYHPLFFYPELQLFKVPEQCSSEVKREITYAFKHFWSDYYSTLNSLRRSLEYLLDQLEIPQKISLGLRLKEFAKKYPDLDELIEAIKIMGNAGSHKDIIEREDVLNVMDIYNHLLYDLFSDNQENLIKEKARKIIKEKGRKRN